MSMGTNSTHMITATDEIPMAAYAAARADIVPIV
jgi:hypothetical protein